MSMDRFVVVKVEVAEVFLVAKAMGTPSYTPGGPHQQFGAQGPTSGYNARGRGERGGRGCRVSYRDQCVSCGYGWNYTHYT